MGYMPRHANKTSFKRNPQAHILLECNGCGKSFERLRSYVKKNIARGKKQAYCSSICAIHYKRGRLHHNYKDDRVGNSSLHSWLRRNMFRPLLCQHCQKSAPRDIANITGVYDREFLNYRWLCKSCHALYDGSINNIPRIRA